MPTLETFVRVAASLPAMPEVAHKLIRSFDRDDLSLRELSELVERDNTLAAKVLRTANSARYSPSHQVTNLSDAAATLGLNHLRDLTMASCLTGTLPTIPGFDRLAFWRGTLAVATYATTLARALDVDEESAYVAGLMLRTGQMLMAVGDPVAFRQVAGLTPRVDGRFAAEQMAFGLTHATVTAELARRWHFPTPLVTAFAAAGAPLEAHPFCRAAAALRLASVVADARDMGLTARQGLQEAQPELLDHLRLDLDWLDAHLPDHSLATAGVDALLH